MLQPWDTDTDAHLHEKSVISVRKEAEFASRVLQEKCPKWSADTLETLQRDEVSGRVQGCAESCSDFTSAKVSTDGPDDDSQQIPEHIEARPRADRSSVAGCNDADLEQTAAQSPGKTLQISSRQQTSLRERERERKRARKLHQTEAKPADSEVQSQVSKDGRKIERRCTARKKRKRSEEEATFSRKTDLSNK